MSTGRCIIYPKFLEASCPESEALGKRAAKHNHDLSSGVNFSAQRQNNTDTNKWGFGNGTRLASSNLSQ